MICDCNRNSLKGIHNSKSSIEDKFYQHDLKTK